MYAIVFRSIDPLLHARATGLRAFVDRREESLHAVVADHVRVRIALATLRQRWQFRFRTVVGRVIRQEDVDTSLRNEAAEPLSRFAVGVEPEAIGPFGCDVSGS